MSSTLRLISTASLIVLCLQLARCGTDESSSSGGSAMSTTTAPSVTTTTLASNNECATTALAAFAENIAPAIDSTCSGCHATNADRRFTSGQNAANRSSLLAYTGTNAQTLKNKIHSTAHDGGNQIAVLPAAKIDAWIAAEAACTQ